MKYKKTEELRTSILNVYDIPVIKEMTDFVSGETAYLNHLYSCKDNEMCLSDISHMLNVTKGRITAMTNSLSKKGFVVPTVDPTDRRRLLLSLTEKGKVYIAEKRERVDTAIDQYISYVGEEQVERIITVLNEAVVTMNESANKFADKE